MAHESWTSPILSEQPDTRRDQPIKGEAMNTNLTVPNRCAGGIDDAAAEPTQGRRDDGIILDRN
jgi:hypothetical protein